MNKIPESIYLKSLNIHIQLKTNKRIKRLSLQATVKQGFILRYPTGLTYGQIIYFIENSLEWFAKTAKKLNEQIEKRKPKYYDGLSINVLNGKIEIKQSSDLNVPIRLIKNDQDDYLIKVSNSIPLDEINTEEAIDKIVDKILKQWAKRILIPKAWLLAKQKKVSPKAIKISSARRRWGSCSSKKSVNLNCHLLRLPEYLIDYVILHEFAHLKVMNHSPKFWKELERLCPNSKQLDKELDQYKISL